MNSKTAVLPRQRTGNRLERKPKRATRRTTQAPSGRLDFNAMPVLGEKERNQATSRILAMLGLEAASVQQASFDKGDVQHPGPRFRRETRAARAFHRRGTTDDHDLQDWRCLTRLGTISLDDLVAVEFV